MNPTTPPKRRVFIDPNSDPAPDGWDVKIAQFHQEYSELLHKYGLKMELTALSIADGEGNPDHLYIIRNAMSPFVIAGDEMNRNPKDQN